MNGRATTVLAFRVPQQTGYNVYDNVLGKYLKGAYEGSVWADPATNAVMKVAMTLVNIPKESVLQATRITLEYKPVDLSGRQFILPSQFEWNWQRRRENGIEGENGSNQINFSACRKFAAESRIDFDK